MAAAHGNTEILKMLFEHGADVNLQAGYYGTALQAAVYNDHAEIAKLLLEAGADINIQRISGVTVYKEGGSVRAKTALQTAVATGHAETQ